MRKLLNAVGWGLQATAVVAFAATAVVGSAQAKPAPNPVGGSDTCTGKSLPCSSIQLKCPVPEACGEDFTGTKCKCS